MLDTQTMDRTPAAAPRAPRPVTDRRSRRRFRELCDEVLASWRVAHERDLWTDSERAEARATLAHFMPIPQR